MNVVVFGAHPDDAELSCGGTLARCRQRGDDVTIVCVTDGSVGTGPTERDSLVLTRRKEAEEAASIIGARLIWLGERDLALFNSDATRKKFVWALRDVRPDLVLAHWPNDYHPDHIAAGRTAMDACFAAIIEGYDRESGQLPLEDIPPLYHMDTAASVGYKDAAPGVGFRPEEFVDISSVMEIKREMFSRHATQQIVKTSGGGLWGQTKRLNKFRGTQCRVQYAEAFSRPDLWQRHVARRLLP